MSKLCPITKTKVSYMYCQECDDRQCETKKDYFTKDECVKALLEAGCENSIRIVLKANVNKQYYVFSFGDKNDLLAEDFRAGYNACVRVKCYTDDELDVESAIGNGGEYLFNNSGIPDTEYKLMNFVYDAFCTFGGRNDERCPKFQVV